MCFVNNNVDSVIVENTESISDKLFIHGKPLRISQPVVNNYVTDIVFLHKFFKCVWSVAVRILLLMSFRRSQS